MTISFGIIASAAENDSAETEMVAKVGSTEYATIDEAVANWTSGTTLTLLSDVTLSSAIVIKSNENHTLNLGTYTMTAASSKNAIEITCENRANAGACLTINADSTNPGGINAGSKACVYYKKSTSTQDRPIITFNGGIFDGTITSSSPNRGTNTPQYKFNGGVFNKSVSLGNSLVIVTGGTFNNSFASTGDSSSYRLIYGGRFKSFGFMTADANNKFTIGTSKTNFNVGLYVDSEGYLVVGGDVITEAGDRFEAMAPYSTWNSYLKYSSAATYGLFYEKLDTAMSKSSKTQTVTAYSNEIDLTAGTTFKGTLKIVTDSEDVYVAYKNGSTIPCTIEIEVNGKIIKYSEISTFGLDDGGIVVRNYTYYDSLDEAIENSVSGDVITLLDDITVDEAVLVGEGIEITLDLSGYDITCTTDGYALDVYGKVTIVGTKDSVISGGICINDENSEVILNDVTVEVLSTDRNGMYAVLNYGGSFTMNSGKLYVGNDDDSQMHALWAYGGETVINGGEIVSDDVYGKSENQPAYALHASNNASVEINGGTINGKGGAIAVLSGSDVSISDATVVADSQHAVYANNASCTITGGTYNKNVDAFVAPGYASNKAEGSYVINTATLEDIIVFKGYSVCEGGTGITAGYSVNKESLAIYCEKNGITVNLGVVYAVTKLDENAIYKSFEGLKLTSTYNVNLKNIREEHHDIEFVMALYVEIAGEKQFVSFDENNRTAFLDAESVKAITYNSVALTETKEENE